MIELSKLVGSAIALNTVKTKITKAVHNMASNNLAQIRLITPTDGKKLKEFNYIQVGTSGDVAIKFQSGEITTLKAGLLDRMALVPIGVADEVLLTGTTAGDVYVW